METGEKMNSQGQGWSQRRRRRTKRRKGTNGEDVMEKERQKKRGSSEKMRGGEEELNGNEPVDTELVRDRTKEDFSFFLRSSVDVPSHKSLFPFSWRAATVCESFPVQEENLRFVLNQKNIISLSASAENNS